MHRTHARILLGLSLTLALAACGSDEPEASTDSPATAAPTTPAPSTQAAATSTAPVHAAPQLTNGETPYERAQRGLTTISSLRIEAELARSGMTQYLSGSRLQSNYTFTLRTLPKPDNAFDGSWTYQAGHYLRQTGGAYTLEVVGPDAHLAYEAAVRALPDKESMLAAGAASPETLSGGTCQPREIDLNLATQVAQTYQQLSVCVDEANERILRISAQTRAGERFTATLSGYGEPVEIPQTAAVKEWWEGMERRK